LKSVAGFALFFAVAGVNARAEDGSAAWLRYAPVSNALAYAELPSRIVVRGNTPVDVAAANELKRGLSALLGREFTAEVAPPITDKDLDAAKGGKKTQNQGPAIRINSISEMKEHFKVWEREQPIGPEEYQIIFGKRDGQMMVMILGGTPQGELYGVFHLLEEIAAQQPIPADYRSAPSAPIRWTDEWDNLNGTIERGYAGPSIFFENGHVRQDLTRAGEYARLLASIGINGCNVNNVNADLDLLTTEHLREFARIADVFRPWGVKLALSIDLTSPQTVGGLDSFDPKDPKVIAWWQKKVDEIYTLIPDFGGFTVKADSEGRKGPSQYGRTPADAANVLARPLAPHHGVVLYRGFVYNNHLDWHDLKADRARAGVDNFANLDGKFDKNVIIQIKEGPIDFQAREPVSPLFAALRHTPEAIELQTTQEYTGQQRHMVWLPSMWHWVLDTDMRADGKPTFVKDIVTGKRFDQPTGGFVSVVNVGMEPNWLHHPVAMANLYGYGKLAWNPDEPLEKIIDTWTRLTWGNDPDVDRTIDAMQLASWHNYESYTGPNGMGTLTNILGYHYGPGIESAERNGWGQWFRGEKDGIGMDRTVATGTGFIGQYPKELAQKYESLATCPDDLLLFFHHVPYDYKLHSGETLVQSIYDTHYAGALAAAEYVAHWESLKGKVDDERYDQVHALFQYEAGHALVWRDAIDNWFQRISGIDDAQGRVAHDPNRIEAESMQTGGYETVDVKPWEDASGGKAVECKDASGCTLTTILQKPAGTYDVAVQYFDMWRGVSSYTLTVNGNQIAAWKADNTLPPAMPDPRPDGETSTRITVRHVALKPGDTLELRGVPDLRLELFHGAQAAALTGHAQGLRMQPDLREFAPVDYIEIGPDGPITPQ
jgi:alpha-glucuronidase